MPKRGEVWNVNFDPSVGAEIRKIRPAVVISSDAVGRLPIKIVVPATEFVSRLGRCSAIIVEESTVAVALVIEYE